MSKKCICQVCSCGKHRCPHVMPKAKAIVNKDPGGCTFSEYHSKYPPHETSRGPFLKPSDKIHNNGDMDFTTTTTLFHEPKELPVRKPKSRKTFVKTWDHMDLLTEYDHSYVTLTQRPASKMAYLKLKTQPFQVDPGAPVGNTVTSSDYQGHIGVAAELVQPHRGRYSPPKEPFSNMSLHRCDFIDFKKRKSPQTRVQDNLMLGVGSFQDETTAKTDFVKHDCLPHIVTKQDFYQPNPNPFEGVSVLKVDFPPHSNAQAAERASWNNQLFETSEKVSSETTNSSVFLAWPLQRKSVNKKDSYRKPEGSMHLDPVSRDFRPFGSDAMASKSMRPKTTIRLGSATFHAKTAYQEVYASKPVTRTRQVPRHARSETYPLAPAIDKTEFVTESMATYKRFQTAPSKYTMKDHDLFPVRKLDGLTTYCLDYSVKELKCPGRDIISNNFSGYDVVDDFQAGHRYLIEKPLDSEKFTLRGAFENGSLRKAALSMPEPATTAIAVS